MNELGNKLRQRRCLLSLSQGQRETSPKRKFVVSKSSRGPRARFLPPITQFERAELCHTFFSFSFFDGKLLQFYLMSFRVVVWTRRRRASVWECQGRGQWHSEAKKKVQKLHNICFSLHSSALVVVDFRLVNYPTRANKNVEWKKQIINLKNSCSSIKAVRANIPDERSSEEQKLL